MEPVWTAFGMTLVAGMATGIGSIVAFVAKRSNYRFLAFSTAFSAGVMLYVSFIEIFVKGVGALTESYGDYWAHWVNAASFFGGIILIGLIDNLVPAAENPHETHSEEEMASLHDAAALRPDFAAHRRSDTELSFGTHDHSVRNGKLMRMGLFTALVIGIHNFPEGLATFLAALRDPATGFAIMTAIALHNIPEGISVSVPIFYATGNRRKAFVYSFLSGLAEPAGAAIAYGLLLYLAGGSTGGISPKVTGILFGVVAGIMVYISIDELLPTSRAYGKGHDSLFGLVGGMAVMALNLLLLK